MNLRERGPAATVGFELMRPFPAIAHPEWGASACPSGGNKAVLGENRHCFLAHPTNAYLHSCRA